MGLLKQYGHFNNKTSITGYNKNNPVKYRPNSRLIASAIMKIAPHKPSPKTTNAMALNFK